jgi:uncharacterized membrane protein
MSDAWEEHSPAAQSVHLLVALLVHLFIGLPLLLGVVGIALASSEFAAGVWGICAVGLWAAGIVRSARRRDDFGAVWATLFGSWVLGALGPIGAAYAAYFWRRRGPQPVEEEPVNPEVERRLELFGRRLEELSQELVEIRRLAEGEPTGERTPVPPQPAVTPSAPPPPSRPAPAPPPPKPVPTYTAAAEPEPRRSYWDRDIDVGDLLGAKGLAWAGGIVTVLGVVFFFVLAVNRGWIGELERVGLGALASLVVFGGGLWLHRRFGPTYAAYGAVGAGLAGGYATLVAAAALYGLVSDLGALAIAAGIAAVGLVTSLVWGSELIAGIGLIGATLIPLMVLLEEDLSPLGTAFAGIVFAATAAVAVTTRWQWLLAAGFLASAPQIAILVADGEVTDWDRVVLAGVFSALYIAAAVGLHWSQDEEGLPTLSGTMVIVSGVLAGATGAALFSGDDRGWAILAAAAAFGVLAAAMFSRERDRDLSALLGAVALALAAVGLAVLLTGPSLAIAWAAEAAVLAWLARRIDEPRYAIAALAYLAAAAVDAVVEAPPEDLYEAVAEPARGALAPLAVALGGAVVAYYSRRWPDGRRAPGGFFAFFEPAIEQFRRHHELWRSISGWLAGIAAVYAASLGVLGVAQWLDDSSVELAFERGHVVVTGLWGLVAFGLVVAGRRIDSAHLTVGGLLLAGATVIQASMFDVAVLDGTRRGIALLVAAATVLATAFADEFPAPRDRQLSVPSALLAVISVALAAGGLLQLTDGAEGRLDPQGLALLGLAVFYLALAALVFKADRDFSTVLWAPALVVSAFAASELVEGTWLVLAWSAVSAALAYLRVAVDEERLAIGSAGYLALALGYALGVHAPPDEFFSANTDPAAGVPSLLCVGAAGAVFAVYAGRERAFAVRPFFWAGIAVLGIYAASLAILGLLQWIGAANVETDFQRGHSAVSAFWGVIGLATLYIGLTRELRTLRLAGFVLFGLALAKLFLYDLANLSSVTRALSFLAVGAVLLLAGFFYQRLTAEPREAEGV